MSPSPEGRAACARSPASHLTKLRRCFEDEPVKMPVDRVGASHDEEDGADRRVPRTRAHAVALLETAGVCIRVALCSAPSRPLLAHHIMAHVLAPRRPGRPREVVTALFDGAPLDLGGPGGAAPARRLAPRRTIGYAAPVRCRKQP
jgi:hypothetical protein